MRMIAAGELYPQSATMPTTLRGRFNPPAISTIAAPIDTPYSKIFVSAPEGVVHPRTAVIALLNAKREAPALALPVRALIDQQNVIAALHGDLRPAAEVPLRAALVAVHHDLHRCARPAGVVFPVQVQPVVGSDPYVLIWEREHSPDHLRHRFPIGGILLRVRQAEAIRLRLFGHGKAEAVAHIGCSQNENKKDQDAPHNDHVRFLRTFFDAWSSIAQEKKAAK